MIHQSLSSDNTGDKIPSSRCYIRTLHLWSANGAPRAVHAGPTVQKPFPGLVETYNHQFTHGMMENKIIIAETRKLTCVALLSMVSAFVVRNSSVSHYHSIVLFFTILRWQRQRADQQTVRCDAIRVLYTTRYKTSQRIRAK